MKVTHPIKPIYSKSSKILILGSFPSVKSREGMFFYHHTQNRFWKVIAYLCDTDIPQNIDEKKNLLLSNGIALWDVIQSCDIHNSSDSSIKNVKVNDFTEILQNSEIKHIFTNGNKSHKLYSAYCEKNTGIKDIALPSTSPANASFNFERLINEWKILKKYL